MTIYPEMLPPETQIFWKV